MRLTPLCVCGTLLALTSLSWTTGEGDLFGDNSVGPCIATLRPEGPCGQGQDENTCPYILTLPPLTVHLPKQLRELEKIVKDLQNLKDNVDELRKICADCTVRQSERGCARQREREHEKLHEGTDRHGDEESWMNERDAKRLKECDTNRAKLEKIEGDGDIDSENRTILEENEKKKWEAERQEKAVVKENEKEDPLKEVADKDGKTQIERAKGKDKLGQAKLPTASEKDRIVDMARERVVENKKERKKETDTNIMREKVGKGFSKGEREDKSDRGNERKMTINTKNKEEIPENDHYVRRDETKETENKTQNEKDKDSDGIKMSREHDEHTNKEQEQHKDERNKEMEQPKQTENTGSAKKEKTIKEGKAGEEEDEEVRKHIKTRKTVPIVQRDSEEEFASSKAPERGEFVSISPTPQSAISLAARHDSMDSIKATTFTSSLPSPPLSNFTSRLITDVNQRMITAYKLPTQSTGAAGISDYQSRSTTTTTTNTMGGAEKRITSDTTKFISTTSRRPGPGFLAKVSSTTTTTAPSQRLYSSALPGVADQSLWPAKKNISSNTKSGVKPLPGQGPKPSEKHKPGIKPEAHQKPKNRKNDYKPPLPDKTTKHDQKPKPSQQKPPADQQSKPNKDAKRDQISKPEQRARSNNLTTAQNLKINQIPKHDQTRTADQNKLPNQKPDSHRRHMPPVQRPTSWRPETDHLTEQLPESVEIPVIIQNSKPDKKLHHPLKADRPDQKQKPGIKMKSEEKNKPDEKSEPKPHFTPVQEPESETTHLAPKPRPGAKLMAVLDENPSPEPKTEHDSTPGQKLTPDLAIKPPDEKIRSSQEIPQIKQKPKPKPNQSYPVLVTDQNPKSNVKPQTNQGLKTPLPDQVPNLNPKSVRDKIPRAESSKAVKPRPPPRQRPPTRPVLKPGATPAQRPKPALQPKPSRKTKTDLDLPHITVTASNSIQNSQTDMPLTSGVVKQIADVTHSPWDTEFSPSTMKTFTLGPETYNSPETGSLPHLPTLPKGFTKSPNSRTTSDLKPQAAGQPSSIPVTPRPNNNVRGMRPESTKSNLASKTDSSLQAAIFHNVEETTPRQTLDPDKLMIPVASPTTQTTFTLSPDFISPTRGNFGPEPPDAESSTPSARELRVKINQVAAQFNNSQTLQERPLKGRPKEHPEENRGGSMHDKTGGKIPRLTSSKVTTTRRDCSDHLLRGQTHSGVYLVTPDIRSKSFHVFCDMELGGGGWTLIQRRQDGSVSFNRTWAEYRSGFGELDGEFWLGNNMIHVLTRDRDMVLRVELEDFGGLTEYAQYELFRVASERLRFRLTVGGYSGTAGDALRFSKMYDHNNRAFTTPDRDHDRYPSGNCGAYYSSGWWFDGCMAANLNGRYYTDKYKGIRDGIFWGTWRNISKEYYPTNDRQSFKAVRMMIRPKGFAP